MNYNTELIKKFTEIEPDSEAFFALLLLATSDNIEINENMNK